MRIDPGPEIRRLLGAREGATAIEYALIACGVSIAIIGGVSSLGNTITTVFYDKLVALF
jgi:Flp pilus assembly pilin Flp